MAVLSRNRLIEQRLVTFMAEGLRGEDLCLFLAPGSLHDEMRRRLNALGIEVDAHLDRSTLELTTGVADFAQMREWAQDVFAIAEQKQARGLRWLEEAGWAQAIGFPSADYYEFHALLNVQVKHYPSIALCQYTLEEMEPQQILSAIAVHRHILIGPTLVRDNPFYIPAEKFIPLTPEERKCDLLYLFREFGFDIEKLLAALVGYAAIEPDVTSQP